jgi:hypothetical protein
MGAQEPNLTSVAAAHSGGVNPLGVRSHRFDVVEVRGLWRIADGGRPPVIRKTVTTNN